MFHILALSNKKLTY